MDICKHKHKHTLFYLGHSEFAQKGQSKEFQIDYPTMFNWQNSGKKQESLEVYTHVNLRSDPHQTHLFYLVNHEYISHTEPLIK